MSERVLIVGASKKEDRYAYKAQKMLVEYGHSVVPVHPTESSILGEDVISTIGDAKGEFDTATLYVRPQILRRELDQLIKLHPKRVIFNPGTEDAEIEAQLEDAGIKAVKACTLVLLRSGKF